MYTTLARVKAELKGDETQKPTGVDQLLMGHIRSVTQRIADFGYKFEPYYYTRKLTPNGRNVNNRAGLLILGDDLLEPLSITVGGQSVSYGADVVNYPNDQQYPIRELRIVNPYNGPLLSWYACSSCQSWFDSIVITGFWGMRTDYLTNGFWNSGIQSPALNGTQTTFTVSDVDGVDPYGRTPMFSAGNLIRIDNEMMDIIATDTTTNLVTVRRAARGSTAAAHNIGTYIYVFEVEDAIVRCATRQACYFYAKRGAFEQVVATDVATATYPPDLVAEIAATIKGIQYEGYVG